MDAEKVPLSRCGIEGCTRPLYRDELCKTHFDQGSSSKGLCEFQGCREQIHAKGKCFTHYQAARRRETGETQGTHIHPTPRPHQLSCRVSDRTLRILEAKGNKGRVGSDVIENWAAEQTEAD